MNTSETQVSQLSGIKPDFSGVKSLLHDYGAMPLPQQILSLVHMIWILPLILYFSDHAGFSISSLAQHADESDVTPASLRECRDESITNWKSCLSAARHVNPLYAVPAVCLASLLAILNAASPLTLQSPALQKCWRQVYEGFTANLSDPRWIRDLALDVRPLLMTWGCLVPPITICFMLSHFIRSSFNSLFQKVRQQENPAFANCLRIRQNIDRSREPERVSFFHSPWFVPAALIPFIFGIPGAISHYLFFHLHVNDLLQHPEAQPHAASLGWLVFYWYPLGACLSALFFRSYFTFAWNFVSTEYDVEVYSDVVKSLPIKGWFADFMTMRAYHSPSQIHWNEVKSIKYETTRIKADVSSTESSFVSVITKLVRIFESVASKLEIHGEYLSIKSDTRTISLNLWEMTSEQKAKLFQTIRASAPFVPLDPSVQEALVGSSILKDPQYTEIWFSVFNDNSTGTREGELTAGQILRDGEYCVSAKIASGGQAVIYSGEQKDGRKVVLKEFQLSQGESLEATVESAKFFESESSILGQLKHPMIVQMLDMFYEQGRVYLVLEHVDGQSLRQHVQTYGPMNEARALSIGEQLCTILQYMHAQEPPVVHRDFTPDNIILRADGTIKLIDFSVAQRKQSGKPSTDCAGKHSYTPPEQFRGAACPQSDIYALGATLYFLATGSDPVPISNSRLPDAGSLLSRVVETATQLELADRYESAEWALNEIRASAISDGRVEDLTHTQSDDDLVISLSEKTEELMPAGAVGDTRD